MDKPGNLALTRSPRHDDNAIRITVPPSDVAREITVAVLDVVRKYRVKLLVTADKDIRVMRAELEAA